VLNVAHPNRPFSQHRASTIFLRVPSQDWPYVISGQRREFRASSGNAPQLWNVKLPTFCVCYRKRRATGDYEWRLLVLEGIRQEKLGAITDEGLVLAGYPGPRDEAFARFRRDWCIREKKKFLPMRQFHVYTVRRTVPADKELMAEALMDHLYGEFLT
jgi:hypothetical protein